MRKLMLLTLVVVFALSAGAVLADTLAEDGLINKDAGSEGSTLWSYHPNAWPGHTACETFVEKTGTGFTWSGIYDYDDYKWICEESTGEVEQLDVTCDIEMYCTETLDASGVYFHIAAPTTYEFVVLNGTLTSNNGQFLGIVVPGQDQKTGNPVLVFQENGFGVDAAQHQVKYGYVPPDIPLSLEFQYYNDGQGSWGYWDGDTWMTGGWDPGNWDYGNNGQDFAWWWGPIKEPCTHDFKIKVDIEPWEHQEDGRYVADPAFVAAPVL